MAQKALYLVAAFVLSGCSYSTQAGAYDGPIFHDSGYYQPVAYSNHGQPILAAPLYFDGVPVTFHAVDQGVYELVDPEGYVVALAFIAGVDRIRVTDLDGNTLYYLHYDAGGYFRVFDPYGAYLAYYGHFYLAQHFHINRHYYNQPFFHSSRKARKRFRARAERHRRAELKKRAHRKERKHSAHRAPDRDRDHQEGKRKKRNKGSGWKPVRRSDHTNVQPSVAPRGLNTGGAVFEGDFAFEPKIEPRQSPRGKRPGRKERRRANRDPQRRQPAATAPTPAPQPDRQNRRGPQAAPPAPPPQTAQTSQSSEPKQEPRSRQRRQERSEPVKHRSGPKNSYRRR